MREYNFIYAEIAKDENDFIGKIAYSIYKEDKISYIDKFIEDNSRNPTEEELKGFHRISSSQSSVERYRLQAESLLQQFLNNTLNEAINEATEEIKSNHILLIRDEVSKIKPAGFWTGVGQNVVATIVLTGIFALILLVINFTMDGFWKTIGNLFGYDIQQKK